MKFKTDGLVIKSNNVGENDRAVVILTRDKGLISAFVSGGRSIKGKNSAATALITYSSFEITKKNDTYRITDSEVHKSFFSFSADILKFSLAQYICELCLAIVPYETEGESEDFLRLALNSLHFIEKGETDLSIIKAVTELRMMAIAGLMPDLSGCRACECEDKFPFLLDLAGGEMLCERCKAAGEYKGEFVRLDKTTLFAMRHIAYSEFNKIYSFSLPESAAKYLTFVTEKYLLAQTDRRFKTLEFLHSL